MSVVPLTPEQRQLVDKHIELVDKAVGSLSSAQRRLMDDEELRGWGREALVEAAQSFDPDRKVPFPGFAWIRVTGALQNVLEKEWKIYEDCLRASREGRNAYLGEVQPVDILADA